MSDYPTAEESMRAYTEGAACRAAEGSPFDNPYHRNWPHPAKGGAIEETMARHWVSGYCNQPAPICYAAEQEGK